MEKIMNVLGHYVQRPGTGGGHYTTRVYLEEVLDGDYNPDEGSVVITMDLPMNDTTNIFAVGSKIKITIQDNFKDG